MRRKFLSAVSAAALLTGLLVAGLVPMTALATPVSGAAFTTTNTNYDGDGHCRNGNEDINCNIYDSKDHVWLTGGPGPSALVDGTYLFTVLDPGGQGSGQDPNDCTDKNLSDFTPCDTSSTGAGDDWTHRVFSIAGGVITYPADGYPGGHVFDSNKIQLMPYDDTPNPGGTYIMSLCNLADATNLDGTAVDGDGNPLPQPGVVPNDCKYDAFKVKEGTGPCDVNCGGGVGLDLGLDKTAAASWTWSVGKSVDKTRVEQIGGSVTFNYTVTVTHTPDGEVVSGVITVSNPNADDVTIDSISDELSDGTACTVDAGSNTVPGNDSITRDYSCAATTYDTTLTNSVTVNWSDQFLFPSGDFLPAGSPTKDGVAITLTDDCSTVTDTFKGTLGTPCAGATNPIVYTYSRVISVPASGCQSYDNTATVTTDDTLTATNSDKITVTVCGPAHTGALTMGFWQNKNGQSIITSYSGTNCQTLATWLKGYHPFSDLTATSCGTSAGLTNKTSTAATGVAGYVYNVVKQATCTNSSKTCNSMLKAQMLATALDVYFGGGTGGNRIGAPSAIGAVSIDLTKVCSMIDGSGGSATCSGSFTNVSAQFGGATCMTVSNMLGYQNTSDPSVDAGAVWYSQVKASQVNAKNAFDAINNQVAFGC